VLVSASLVLGYVLGWAHWRSPLASEVKKALKRDGALGIIFRRDGTCVIRAVDLDGDYVVDEKGQRMWEVKRMSVVEQRGDEKVVVKGSDKPAILVSSRVRVPVYVLHEDNAQAPSNPSMVLVEPDALISPISARSLYTVRRMAEVLGMLKERNKMRDAMFYATIFIAMAIAAVIVIAVVNAVLRG